MEKENKKLYKKYKCKYKSLKRGGSESQPLQLEHKIIQQVVVNTFAIPNTAEIGIQILPNPSNPHPSFSAWEGKAHLTSFAFTQEYISNFQSYISSTLTPMDCFINACQLIGVLDTLNANILRISCAGSQGFTLDSMEKIFTLKSASLSPGTVKYFNFTDFNKLGGGIDLFAKILNNNLQPNHAAFCGWAQSSGAHVFIIAKDNSGNLVYLDPQQTGSPCALTNNQDCVNLLENGKTPDRRYFILYNTETSVPINIIKDLGFDPSPGRNVEMQGTVFS